MMRYTPSENSFVDRISEACKTYADRPCVQFGTRKYSYAEVDRRSSSIAATLQANGFQKGDHAAIYSLNSAIVLITTLGILRAGGVWMPINPRNAKAENVRALATYKCKAIFYQQAFLQAVEDIAQSSADGFLQFDIDRQNYLSKGTAPDLDIQPDDLISLPMTGGTTSQPKCVMLTNANFNAIADGLAEWYRDYDDLPSILCVAPMTHVGGRIAMAAMLSGAQIIVHEKFDPKMVLETIDAMQVTDLFLPPTAIYTLLAEPDVHNFDYSSLRNFLYGSAPIALEKLKQCLKIFGPVMRGAYGQTESPLFITGLAPEEHLVEGKMAPDARLSSVGHATNLSELSILDDHGDPVPQGELGEVAAKGPMVCAGYYENKPETDKIRKNGWHLTGDIGYLDAEGCLHLMDRKKDMIITGGFNVYSVEVEYIIDQIPGVLSSQVIGVPSEKWGEEVKALVQKEADSAVTIADILEICKEQLGSVKMPKSAEFREEFPITPLGKVDKKALRAAYWKEA